MTTLTPAAARLLLRALAQIHHEVSNSNAGTMPALTSTHLTVIKQLQDATERLIQQNGDTAYLDRFIVRRFPRIPLDEIKRQLTSMAREPQGGAQQLPAPSQNETLHDSANTVPSLELDITAALSELCGILEDMRCHE